MQFLNKKKDNIISIIKSLHPIKYLYSKQNKDYDKYFRGSSLKDFVKQMNSPRKIEFFTNPDENINEFVGTNTGSGIDFKSAFNYFQELSNLKKLPLSVFKGATVKTARNNSEDTKSKNKKKKNKNNEKEIKMNNKIKNNNGDADVTLDPGRYNPRYDYILRRYPCAYLGKPKKSSDSLPERNNRKENDGKNSNKNLNKTDVDIDENEDNIKTDNNSNLKNKKKNKKLIISYSNRSINRKDNTVGNYKKINIKIRKNIKMRNKDENKKDEDETKKVGIKKIKLGSHPKLKGVFPLLKEQNTASSWYNTNYYDNTKKSKNKLINDFYRTQRIFRNDRRELNKKLSCENIKCLVMFDKMLGRERKHFIRGRKESSKIPYHPDYNFNRPHVPATIFKYEKNYQDVKKYMTGKIIRSYRLNPEEYFVFEYNKNKDSEMSEKYGTIFLKL